MENKNEMTLEQWIDSDLGKSGLTRDDLTIVPFEAKINKRTGEAVNNGGYCIVYETEGNTPILRPDGKPFFRQRFRPPYPTGRKGDRMKYATLPGTGNHCYIQQAVYAYLKENPDAPIYLTEGEKKAAKATKEGLPIIGLAGIWNWLAPGSERHAVTDRYKIHDELARFLHPGREVVIIYDSDARESNRKAVGFDGNTLRLACELLAFQCPLYRVDLPQPGDEKIGLDDFLMTHSMDELQAHIAENRRLISEEEALSIADPYKELAAVEGEPYTIKLNSYGIVTKISLNQNWNAGFLMQNHRVLYEPGEARFYLYDEERGLWVTKTDDYFKTLLANELGEYWRRFHSSDKNELLPQRTDRTLKDSINRLRGMAERENAFERSGDKPVIHLREGMLDLENLTLNEFAPEYYSRNMIPIPFREEAECPRFLNELLAPALSDEAIAVLQKYFGMCILGYNYSQQFLLLEGTAGGGKGTLTDILRNIVGVMNVAEMRTHQLNERFELAAFFDKTLLIGSDVPGNFLQRSGAETLKKLTGHDLVEAEFKGANKRGRMKGVFNAVITSNNRLRVRLDGDAEAWRRRMILVRFTNPPVAKKIVNFAGMLLKEEGSGILNWMIHGAVMALNEFKEYGKIALPESIQKDADELLYESNTLNNFLDERVVLSTGGDVSTVELQNAYVRYCNMQNLQAQDSRSVATRLCDLMREKFGASRTNSIVRNGQTARGYRNVALLG